MGSKSDGADLENPQVLHYSQLALDLRSAIAAVAMRLLTAAEIPDLPCLDITVIKMDGSKFKVECMTPGLAQVSQLKRAIAVQENISCDVFDLSSAGVVLKSPEQLNLTLSNAGIVDTVSMTMKKGEDYDSDKCTVCREPHMSSQVEKPVCRKCYYLQLAERNKAEAAAARAD